LRNLYKCARNALFVNRKLISQGGSGVVAYIPKKWVVSKGLKAGDEVNFKEEEGDLIVSAKEKKEKKKIVLDMRDADPLFIKIIVNDMYRTGYDRIEVKYETKSQFKVINEVVNRFLLGFEVTEHLENRVILENIMGASEEKQDVLLRRMFLIIKEMFDLIEQDGSSRSYQNHDYLLQLKRKIGQYDNFSRRNISKKKFYEESFYWTLYNHLYLICHSLIHLYDVMKPRYVLKNDSLFIDLKDFFGKMYVGFFEKDVEKLRKINTPLNNFLYSKVQIRMLKARGKESLVLYYYGELARLMYKTNSPIIGILLHTNPKRVS